MPSISTSRRATLSAIAALALMGSLPAQALGRLSDVQVIDRDSSEVLPVYRHQGEYWVAGRPGARYAVSIQNKQSGRVLGVVSVDGINAVSGETAAFHQTGYVLGAWQAYRVTGWRKSDEQVAAVPLHRLSCVVCRTHGPARSGGRDRGGAVSRKSGGATTASREPALVAPRCTRARPV